jgi:hypothetical protein
MAPASIRYKNPGAMWGSPLAKKWGSTHTVKLNDGTGQGNNIAVFPTYVNGICAQLDLWRTSKNYRNKKFKDAIRIWSGGNHVESYIKFVLARVPGMSRDTVMDDAFWMSDMGIAFLKAQAWHEAGKRYPAPDADWIEAQRIVFGGRKPRAEVPDRSQPVGQPAVQSKTIVAEIGSLLTAVMAYVMDMFGYLTDWRVILFIVAAVSLFVIYERYKKDDIKGLFRSKKTRRKKKRAAK